MHGLIDLADRCFIEIINDEDFVLGLDTTGIYALTGSMKRDEVLIAFRQLKKDLSLKESEAMLCYVGETGGVYINETTPEEFERWLREVASKRPRIFDRHDLQEIENCYKECIEEDSSLVNVLREFGLTDGVIHTLIEKRPQNIKEVRDLGVVQEVAEDVFEILCQGMYERKEGHQSVPSGVTVSLASFQKRKCGISLVFATASGLIILLSEQAAVAFVVAVIGLLYARRAAAVGTILPVRMATLVNVVIMVTSGLILTIRLFLMVQGGRLW